MKKILSLVCVAMFTLYASAQVTYNVKLGGGMAWNSFSESPNGGTDNKAIFVGKVGAGIELPISQNFSVMPSLELALKGGKLQFDDETQKINTIYIQLPVMAAYRFALSDRLNMTVKAGPYFAYGLSGKGKYNDGEDSDEFDIFSDKDMGGNAANRFDIGGIAGVDFEYHRFVVGAEFEYGFTDFYKRNNQGYSCKMKNMAAYVTVGYKF